MSAKQALVHAIRSEMARQGISRRILARRLECTQENIAQMLDDQRSGMRLNTAEKLATALGRRLFLALIPDTSLETTFTFPLDVAERVDSEARRQNIPPDEFVLQLIVKALEIEERTALRGEIELGRSVEARPAPLDSSASVELIRRAREGRRGP
jgi:transcriptional regulator with XRE-family HTH domain